MVNIEAYIYYIYIYSIHYILRSSVVCSMKRLKRCIFVLGQALAFKQALKALDKKKNSYHYYNIIEKYNFDFFGL